MMTKRMNSPFLKQFPYAKEMDSIDSMLTSVHVVGFIAFWLMAALIVSSVVLSVLGSDWLNWSRIGYSLLGAFVTCITCAVMTKHLKKGQDKYSELFREHLEVEIRVPNFDEFMEARQCQGTKD